MQDITISKAAFFALLRLIHCNSKLMMPDEFSKISNATEFFLKGRQELCERGWLELDFDGKLLQNAEFARFIYGFTNVCGIIKYENSEVCEYYVRAPVEILYIKVFNDSCFIKRCKAGTVLDWARDILYTTNSGVVFTEGFGKRFQTVLNETPSSHKNRAEAIKKHLFAFFSKEEV